MSNDTTYDAIVEGVAQRLGVPPEQLAKTDSEPLKRFFNEAFREVWTSNWWIDNTVISRRYFREQYESSKEYSYGDEVYDPVSAKYYMALQTSTGQAVTSLAHWAESLERYDGLETFDVSKTYAVGDQVSYQDYSWQCIAVPPSNEDPTNTTYWAPLNPFIKALPWSCEGYVSSSDLQGASAVSECKRVRFFNTLVEFRAFTEYADNCFAMLLGVLAKGDIAPIRMYSFYAADTDSDTGREVIKPDNITSGDPGRWKQVL